MAFMVGAEGNTTPTCNYCEDFKRTKRFDRPDTTLWKIDCPTNRVGIIEVAWLCAVDGCYEHIQSFYYTIQPLPEGYALHEYDCDQ